MIWRPKYLKYRKYQKLKKKYLKLEHKNYFLKKGNIGLKIIQSGYITSWQLETIRVILTKTIKTIDRTQRMYLLVFPLKGLTRKPKGVRMGKGKGKVNHWIAPVLKGKILLELKNVKIGYTMLNSILPKLPVRCIFQKKLV